MTEREFQLVVDNIKEIKDNIADINKKFDNCPIMMQRVSKLEQNAENGKVYRDTALKQYQLFFGIIVGVVTIINIFIAWFR